jgi:threonine dehydratase
VEIEKTVAEGAGAAALAAVFADRERYANQRVGVVISGGNIDSRLLASILMRGLVRDGRLVWFRVMVSDAPGALARVANLIGEGGGNIVEISHQRLFHNVPIKMAELDVVVETRTRQHVQQLLESLAAGGFPATLLGEPDGA